MVNFEKNLENNYLNEKANEKKSPIRKLWLYLGDIEPWSPKDRSYLIESMDHDFRISRGRFGLYLLGKNKIA